VFIRQPARQVSYHPGSPAASYSQLNIFANAEIGIKCHLFQPSKPQASCPAVNILEWIFSGDIIYHQRLLKEVK